MSRSSGFGQLHHQLDSRRSLPGDSRSTQPITRPLQELSMQREPSPPEMSYPTGYAPVSAIPPQYHTYSPRTPSPLPTHFLEPPRDSPRLAHDLLTAPYPADVIALQSINSEVVITQTASPPQSQMPFLREPAPRSRSIPLDATPFTDPSLSEAALFPVPRLQHLPSLQLNAMRFINYPQILDDLHPSQLIFPPQPPPAPADSNPYNPLAAMSNTPFGNSSQIEIARSNTPSTSGMQHLSARTDGISSIPPMAQSELLSSDSIQQRNHSNHSQLSALGVLTPPVSATGINTVAIDPSLLGTITYPQNFPLDLSAPQSQPTMDIDTYNQRSSREQSTLPPQAISHNVQLASPPPSTAFLSPVHVSNATSFHQSVPDEPSLQPLLGLFSHPIHENPHTPHEIPSEHYTSRSEQYPSHQTPQNQWPSHQFPEAPLVAPPPPSGERGRQPNQEHDQPPQEYICQPATQPFHRVVQEYNPFSQVFSQPTPIQPPGQQNSLELPPPGLVPPPQQLPQQRFESLLARPIHDPSEHPDNDDEPAPAVRSPTPGGQFYPPNSEYAGPRHIHIRDPWIPTSNGPVVADFNADQWTSPLINRVRLPDDDSRTGLSGAISPIRPLPQLTGRYMADWKELRRWKKVCKAQDRALTKRMKAEAKERVQENERIKREERERAKAANMGSVTLGSTSVSNSGRKRITVTALFKKRKDLGSAIGTPNTITDADWREFGQWARPRIRNMHVDNITPRDLPPNLVSVEQIFRSLTGRNGSPHPENWVPGLQHPSLPPRPAAFPPPDPTAPPLRPSQYTLNPFFRHSRWGPGVIQWDIRAEPTTVFFKAERERSGEPCVVPVGLSDFAQPATHPLCTSMRIAAVVDDAAKTFPWAVEVHNPLGVRCEDVFRALSTNFRQRITREEWASLNEERQGRVANAWKERCRIRDQRLAIRPQETVRWGAGADALRRVDYLGDRVRFRGLEPLGDGDPEQGWMMFVGPL